MADEIKQPDGTQGEPSGTSGNGAGDNKPQPSQTETELKKVKVATKGRLLHAKGKIEKQLAALDGADGGTPTTTPENVVTVEMLEEREAEKAKAEAVTLADDIQDPAERDLVKHHLEHTIKLSGNPKEDLKNARALANHAKNVRVLEEDGRIQAPRTHSSAPGAPANTDPGAQFQPTYEEAQLMRGFGLTKEDVLKARKVEAEKRGNQA